MKILITNLQLDERTGTEVVVRDLDAGLRRRGHDVCVYTPRPGALAEEMRADGAIVVDDVASTPWTPDVIHGHQTVETATALAAFPTTPALYVCHDRLHPDDAPLRSPAVRRYVSVDRNCDERIRLEAGIPAELTRLIHNAVDMRRFVPRDRLPRRPRRVAVFSNYAVRGGYVEEVRAACAARGLDVEVIGAGVGTAVDRPEEILGRYDLVVGKGRCVLEALAVGCAVVVADAGGLASIVTADDVADLRDWNFGARCLQRPVTASTVGEEIDRYDPRDAARASAWIRQVADLERALDAYEALYEEVRLEGVPDGHRTTWVGLLDEQVARAGALEAVARSGAVLLGSALSPGAAHQVALRPLTTPGFVEAGATTSVLLAVRNGSSETLHSLGDAPLFASYHLLDADGRPMGIEGERTRFETPLPPGAERILRVRVQAPGEPGRCTVALDLVQEGRTWLRDLTGRHGPDLDLVVESPREGDATWTLSRLALLEPVDVVRDAVFTTLRFATAPTAGMLTFAESPVFLDRALASGAAAAVVVPPALVDQVPAPIGVITSETPRGTFARLHEALATRTDLYRHHQPSTIDPSADVHPSAVIDEIDVEIGPGVVIGPHVTLSGPVRLEADVRVMAGAVLGSAGFQTITDGGRRVEMPHAGGVAVGARTVVFPGAIVARGLFGTDTTIGADGRIGNGAFVSHDCRVGERTTIGHGAVVNGNVEVGSDTWLGPGATVSNNLRIGDGARVSLGATVISEVPDGGHVTGLPAMGHAAALRAVASMRKVRR
ncbi:hypothetical protein [Actinomarinicola tropica]|uniref:Glycosyltransferase n=1 Tax=Actinomarinicola tropica TaxID=2789776 RepID=A0A5Q2RLW5_9ACTN|nr:hypothetical protein [Actinomarinicola tropica]QGG95416.1 hypothetical protein GH723_10085 [Actinomarinicola tropica]